MMCEATALMKNRGRMKAFWVLTLMVRGSYGFNGASLHRSQVLKSQRRVTGCQKRSCGTEANIHSVAFTRGVEVTRLSAKSRKSASEASQDKEEKRLYILKRRIRNLMRRTWSFWLVSNRRGRQFVRKYARVLVLVLLLSAFSANTMIKNNAANLAETSATAVQETIPPKEMSWGEFVLKLKAKNSDISELVVSSERYDFFVGAMKEKFYAVPLPAAPYADRVTELALTSGIDIRAAPVVKKEGMPSLATIIAVVYICFVIGALRQMMRGGVGNIGNVASRKRKRKTDTVTFEDIAGINAEARRQVMDIRDLVASQANYAKLGARAPKGILLVGPPGTGKTLLARALANEARMPFVYCSGSDFVEIFAGRGAARVRGLFQKANKFGKCIIFIDELDAVGRARRDGPNVFGGGANDEQEQTLNQLLACMDGVEQNKGIIVLAATNRLSILDQALLRAGRFDRIVRIDPPDAQGRLDILRIHASKLTLDPSLDLDATLPPIAQATPGLVGADLSALCNEAAINAARRYSDNGGSPGVTAQDFDMALDLYLRTRRPNQILSSTKPFSLFGGAR